MKVQAQARLDSVGPFPETTHHVQDHFIDQIGAAHRTVIDARDAGTVPAWRRLARLLDAEGIVEYGMLAGEKNRADDPAAADGLIAVAGTVSGSPVVAAAFDETVLDGTQSDRNLRKLAKLIFLARRHRWPLILFLTGAGARASDPGAVPPILAQGRGRWDILDGLAELSGWSPTVAVLSGAVEDGHLALAMLCDCVIAERDAMLGSAESGAVEARSYALSGDLDILADDAESAASAARNYLAFYNSNNGANDSAKMQAHPDHDALADVIPENRRRPYDMRKVIHRFADDASVLELGAEWGKSMLTCLARLEGRTIGIFANQPKSPLAGAIDWQAADKAARFIELCNAYAYPLTSFVDNPGYMVGPQAEAEGIARHHPRPLSALHHRSVPLCTVQVRKAYGLGPSAMSGFGVGRVTPELRLAWPSVESGGMSLEGAAFLVKRREILAAETPAEATAIRDAYAEQMRDATSGVRAGRSYQFDDVILPVDTRRTIASLLGRTDRRLPATRPHPIDPR